MRKNVWRQKLGCQSGSLCYAFSNTVNNLQLHLTSQSQTDSQGTPREAVEIANIIALTKTDKPLSFSAIFGNDLSSPSSNLLNHAFKYFGEYLF